mgnify:CR=1 FL=1
MFHCVHPVPLKTLCAAGHTLEELEAQPSRVVYRLETCETTMITTMLNGKAENLGSECYLFELCCRKKLIGWQLLKQV